MLCLSLSGKTVKACLEEVWRNRQYIQVVELRLDLLEPDEIRKASAFPSQIDLPVILTFRRERDGGKCTLDEKERLRIFKEVALGGSFAYVDLEEDVKRYAFENELKKRGVIIIRSFHDFDAVPTDAFNRMSKIAARGEIPKVAIMPHGIQDLITVFKAEEELVAIPRKIIVAMGPYGIPARILYKRTGSMLTYCSEKSIAPGLLSPRLMSEVYRSDRISAHTSIYGVIGNPVYHSDSPRIHNAGFQAIHFDAVYLPFQVDNIRAFFRLAEMLKIHGFSVTIPYKTDVIPFLGKNTREVKQISSCNTVVRIQGMWKGINTDYYGFLRPIEQDFTRHKIQNVLVIGAGGAARAIVWALKNRQCNVTILNRTGEKARQLASETMSSWDLLSNASQYSGKADMIVQATALGMPGILSQDPAPDLEFTGREIVYEIIYKPKTTPFLERAIAKGCSVRYGWDMLFEQAKYQFEAFTGYHWPPNVNPVI